MPEAEGFGVVVVVVVLMTRRGGGAGMGGEMESKTRMACRRRTSASREYAGMVPTASSAD